MKHMVGGAGLAPWAIFSLLLMVPTVDNLANAGDEQLVAVATNRPVDGNSWLQGQPGNHFTLQLLATRSSRGVDEFAEQEGFSGPLFHFVVEVDGQEMHLLSQGSFATHAEAEQATKALPPKISPWIRSLASIRKVMINKVVAEEKAPPVAMEKAPPAVEERAVVKKKAPPLAAIQDGGVKDMPWLWSQDPQAYTIQLAGSESLEAVEAVMRQLALPGERMVVRTLVDDKPWYTLIYGLFADEAAARATIGRLAAPLQQAKPWARRYASLHDELSRATPVR